MHLGLWAFDDDVAAHALAAHARSRGHAVTLVTPDAAPDSAAADATDLRSWVLGGADLDACDAHLVRALPSAFVTPRDGETPADVARRAFEAQERVQLAAAALASLEARGVRIVNPTASLPFEAKPHQLAAFSRAGLPIPRTMITSLPLAATHFVDALAAEGAQTVVKPLVGGATARLVDDAVRARFASLGPAPVILQERVAGDDVRVTVVDGAVRSAVIIDSSALDYRDDPGYAAGRARYRDVTLSEKDAALAVSAAATCAHVVSGVDFKRASDGRLVLLEANSAPRWLDIEEKTGAPLTAAILAALGA